MPTSGWHPYWADSENAIIPEDAVPSFLIDGFAVPDRFIVNRTGSPYIGEIKYPMEFVLVREQNVDVGHGIELPVTHPFFVCTTELSNWQMALFTAMQTGNPEKYLEERAAEESAEISSEILSEQFLKYRRDETKPAVLLEGTEFLGISHEFADLTGFSCRWPTIGEWFAAMRANADTYYWWGDDWGGSTAQKIKISGFRSIFEFIPFLEDVGVGEQNPLGLFNIIGNASEIAIPSLSERRLLREHFGRDALSRPVDKEQKKHRLYTIFGYSVFKCGGSVFSCSPEISLDILGLVQARQIMLQQTDLRRSLLTGRLVIDCPTGVIEEIE